MMIVKNKSKGKCSVSLKLIKARYRHSFGFDAGHECKTKFILYSSLKALSIIDDISLKVNAKTDWS